MLPPTLLDRQREIGIQQVEIDARPARLLQRWIRLFHVANIGRIPSHAKPDFPKIIHRRCPRLSIRPHPSPAGFYAGAVLLRLNHPCLLTTTFLAVTTTILGLFILPRCCRSSLSLLELCTELCPSQLSIDGL